MSEPSITSADPIGAAARARSEPAARTAQRRRDRALAALCRGSTLVLGDGAGLAEALRSAGLDRARSAPGEGLAAFEPASQRTVVLLDLLPADDERAVALLASAWERVKPGGRLVLVVANALAVPRPGARTRRELRRLLEALGRPRIHGEQPFRWLVMHVKKAHPGESPVPPSVAERYDALAGLCRGRVLELGCGPGHLAGAIAARGHEVVGMDLNAAKIRQAAATYPSVRFFQGDAADLDVGEDRFDTAVIAEVLEHVAAPVGDRILAAARAALRPGGRLVVSVPNEKCIPHPNHVRTFDVRGLRALLRPHGAPQLVVEQPYKWLIMYVDCL